MVTAESPQTTATKRTHRKTPSDLVTTNPDTATLLPGWCWVSAKELSGYNLAGPLNHILREVDGIIIQ